MMLIIIIIVGLLSIYMERSYKQGVVKGRCEVIEENIVRLEHMKPLPDRLIEC